MTRTQAGMPLLQGLFLRGDPQKILSFGLVDEHLFLTRTT
jgi:hypothetical protein